MKGIVLAYDRGDAVHRRLDIEAHLLLSQPALNPPPEAHTHPNARYLNAT